MRGFTAEVKATELAFGYVKSLGIISRNIVRSKNRVPCATVNFTSKIHRRNRERIFMGFPIVVLYCVIEFPCKKSFSFFVKTKNRTHDLYI